MGQFEVCRCVNSVFTSNTYILNGKSDQWVWLIDIGDFCKVKSVLSTGCRVKGCFITHSHFDHIYGLNELVKEFPDCVVYVSKYGEEGLFSAKANFSFYHEHPFVFQGKNVKILDDGCNMELQDGLFLNAILTPGHDKGCLCYKIRNYLFTGDSYIPGVKTVTKLRGGNKEDNEKSLVKIRTLISTCTNICPGHGPIVRGRDLLVSSNL